MTYEIIRMDECCISISDGDHLPPPKSDSGVPFITISNIDTTNNTIGFSNTMFVPEAYYDALQNIKKATPGDILYSVVGTFGVPVQIKTEKKFVFQRHIAILRPNKDVVLPEYLYYVMKSGSFYAQADAFAVGSAQRTIGLSSLRKMKAAIPCVEEQEKTVTVLAAYDNLIEINNKRINVLEQMAENLYKEWFVRFRFPGHETAEFENGIPKEWNYQRLPRLLDVRYGKDHKNIEDGVIPVLGSGGVMRFCNKALFSGESVLIPRKGSLNNLMYQNGPFWTVDTMFYSVPKLSNFAKYAYYALSKIDMESYNSGAALPSMTTDILSHFKLLVPDSKTLSAFDSFVSNIYKKKNSLLKANENLTKQRDLLLPRLMSGKLEV